MEPKHVKPDVSGKHAYAYEPVTKVTGRGAFGFHGNKNWIGYAVCAVCVVSIITNVVLVFLHIGLSRESVNHKVAIDKIYAKLALLEAVGPRTHENHAQSDWSLDNHGIKHQGHHRHHNWHRLRKWGRDRRHLNGNSILPRPVTQLQGINASDHEPAHYNNALLWRSPRPGTFRNSFYYEYHRGEAGTFITGIEVKRPGIYYVFSQLAMSGKSIPNTDISECGFDLVRQRSSNETVLTGVIITQDQEGRRYPRRDISGGSLYPLDTVSIQGVFKLHRNDVIRVRVQAYCQRYARLYARVDRTHFGAFLINEM